MRSHDVGEPPADLEENDFVAKVVKSRGNTFEVEIAKSDLTRLRVQSPGVAGDTLLVGLAPKLRNQYFIRRGGLAVISVEQQPKPEAKVSGTLTNIVSDRRAWQRMPYWPPEFVEQKEDYDMDLPPSSDEDDYEDDGEDVHGLENQRGPESEDMREEFERFEGTSYDG